MEFKEGDLGLEIVGVFGGGGEDEIGGGFRVGFGGWRMFIGFEKI